MDLVDNILVAPHVVEFGSNEHENAPYCQRNENFVSSAIVRFVIFTIDLKERRSTHNHLYEWLEVREFTHIVGDNA